MDGSDKILEGIHKILETCLNSFGVGWTLVLIFLVPTLFFVYRLYTDWLKRKEVNAVVAAKDQTIQVLAEDNRQLRVQIFRKDGWSERAIEAFVLKNIPKDPLEARKMLEDLPKETATDNSKLTKGKKPSK